MTKPIKIFWSELSQRFYASNAYKQNKNIYTITGAKTDVTNDIGEIINKYDITFSVAENKETIH